MELQWVRYTGKHSTRYLLVLRLGILGGTAHLVNCPDAPSGEVELIKALRPTLRKLSLEERIAWLKRTCPLTYRNAYRKLPLDRIEVINDYQ